MMAISRTVEYEDGEFIILEGGESDGAIYVVLEGQVKVIKETGKTQVTLALLEEGDILGEVSFLAQRRGKRSASAVAKGRVKIGILDREFLAAEYQKLSPSFQKMLKDLAERFSKTTALTARVAASRLERPNLERRQARRSSAVRALRVKVEYLAADQDGRATFSGKETHQGVLLDLAKNGMGLELFTTGFSEATHPLGAKFIFQFTLPGKPMIRVPGHIVWLREMGSKKARMGVKFAQTNPYLRKLIQDFLKESANH